MSSEISTPLALLIYPVGLRLSPAGDFSGKMERKDATDRPYSLGRRPGGSRMADQLGISHGKLGLTVLRGMSRKARRKIREARFLNAPPPLGNLDPDFVR